MITGYLAPLGLEEPLEKELRNIVARYDRLFLAEGDPQPAYWAQNIWHDAQTIPFQSISEAAKKLRSLNGLWAHYPYMDIRRGELIASHLPFFSPKPLSFGTKAPNTPLGSWTLLDKNTLLASKHCSSPFAHGEIHFQETPIPPSRAYLKLWEILTRIDQMPKKGDQCLELGASPGSWTWVLQQLGTKVIAVDRAKLDPAISALPNVSFMKKDAFSIQPKDFPSLNWIFSDLICYPEKLLQWLAPWLETDVKLVCTLKFQGENDYEIVKEFEKIPNSQIFHLFHNKHELTWVRT